MRPVQSPISDEEEDYHGCQHGRNTLSNVVREREQRLIEAPASGDEALIEARRFELLHVLADRQAISDVLQQNEERVTQNA